MVTVRLYEDRPIGVDCPRLCACEITEADPVVKGQTAASSYKPAMLENGVRVLVPPHIERRRRASSSTPTKTPTSSARRTEARIPMARSALLNVMARPPSRPAAR